MVEGSVRRGGENLRINAQLIDAATGGHLWAETFDGPAGDVFALQDRINAKIVSALKVQLTPDEKARVLYRGTENIAAYDAFQRGERFRLHSKVRAENEAILEYERAIELDPSFGAAYAALGHVLWHRARFKGGGTPTADRTRVQELVNAALDLREDPRTHTLLAKIYLFDKDDHARAEAEARKAIDIDPNSSEGLATLAEILLYTNQAEAATEILQMSMRLNPGFPNSYQILLAQAWFEQKRYRDVINLLETVCEGASIWRHYRTCRYYRASAHGHLGELKSGREGTDLYIFSDGWETVIVIWFPFKYESSREHLMEGVRKILQDN